MLIRGFYYEGWDPTDKPVRERHKEQFLAHIEEQFINDDSIDPEVVARGVFFVLSHRVTDGEIADVMHILPEEFAEPLAMTQTSSAAASERAMGRKSYARQSV